MSNEQKTTDNMGLLVVGQIMAKNHFPGSNGKPDRFSVDVAVPGIRQMLTIALKAEDWMKAEVMTLFKAKLTYNLYNGRLYFQPAAA